MNLAPVVIRRSLPINRETLIAASIFGLLSFCGNLFTGYSLETVSPPITSVILRTQTIMIIFLSGIVLNEVIGFSLILGSIVAIIGISIISLAQGSFHIQEMMGIIWAALSAFSFAIIQLVNKYYIDRIHPLSLNLIRMLIGVILTYFIIPDFNVVLSMSLYVWGLCAFASVFGTTISRLASLYSLKYIPVSHATLISTTTPVFTLLLSLLLLDFPKPQELVGGALVLSGLSLPLLHKVFSGKLVGMRSRLILPWGQRQ